MTTITINTLKIKDSICPIQNIQCIYVFRFQYIELHISTIVVELNRANFCF